MTPLREAVHLDLTNRAKRFIYKNMERSPRWVVMDVVPERLLHIGRVVTLHIGSRYR